MEIIGIIPCGGLGVRMGALKYPKELLPICYHQSNVDNSIRPKLSIEYSIEAFQIAGIKKCFVIIPSWKPEIMRYLDNGNEFGMNIAYLYNSKANGLADAIITMEPWSLGKLTCLALPDTQFLPINAISLLVSKLVKEDADLVLGVFPSDEPQHFAPVEFDNNGKVLSVEEKPLYPKHQNTWGTAIWNTKFWNFFKAQDEIFKERKSITEAFNKAIIEGLKVYCEFFREGSYYDIGRIDSLPFVKNIE